MGDHTTRGRSATRVGILHGVLVIACFTSLIAAAILNSIGVPDRIVTVGLVALGMASFVGIGLACGTTRLADYLIAGRRLPSVYNGMAGAAAWLPAISFVALSDTIFAHGMDAVAISLGGIMAIAVSGALFAPYLARSGAFSIPDFLALRFDSQVLRLLAVLVVVSSAGVLLVVQLQTATKVFAFASGIGDETAFRLCLAILAVATFPGGLRGLTWVQTTQYVLLLGSLLAPAVWIGAATFGNPEYGAAIVSPSGGVTSFVAGEFNPLSFMLLALSAMTGVACMPHGLMRYTAADSGVEARRTGLWMLFFVALVAIALPTYIAMAHEVLPPGNDAASSVPTLVEIPISLAMPAPIAALATVGLLGALLAAAGALLVAIATTLGHDICFGLIDRNAPAGRRLIIFRVILLAVLLVTSIVSASLDWTTLASWSFSMIASGLFPVLVLAVWWRRTNAIGAIVGMIAGFSVCASYMLSTHDTLVIFADFWRWVSVASGVRDISAAAFGVPVGFAVAIAASLLTRAPTSHTQRFLDLIRRPMSRPLLPHIVDR